MIKQSIMKLAAVVLLIAGSAVYGDSSVQMVANSLIEPPVNMLGADINYGTSIIPVTYVIPGEGSIDVDSFIAGSVFGKLIFAPVNPSLNKFFENRLFLGSVRIDDKIAHGYFYGNMGNVIQIKNDCIPIRDGMRYYSIAFANLKEDKERNITGDAYAVGSHYGPCNIAIYKVKSSLIDSSAGSPIQLTITCVSSQILNFTTAIVRLSTLNLNDYLHVKDGETDKKRFEDQIVIEFSRLGIDRNTKYGDQLTDAIAIAHIQANGGYLGLLSVGYYLPNPVYPSRDYWHMATGKDYNFNVITGGYVVGVDQNNLLGIYLPYVGGSMGKVAGAWGFESENSGYIDAHANTLFIPFKIANDYKSVELNTLYAYKNSDLNVRYSSTHWTWPMDRANAVFNSGVILTPYDFYGYWQYMAYVPYNNRWNWSGSDWNGYYNYLSNKALTYKAVATDKNTSYNYKYVQNPLIPSSPRMLKSGGNLDITVDMTGSGPYDLKNNNSDDISSKIRQGKESLYEQGYRVFAVVYGQPFFGWYGDNWNSLPLINFGTGTIQSSSTTKTKGSGYSFTGEYGINTWDPSGFTNDKFMETGLVSNENSYSDSWSQSVQMNEYKTLQFRYDSQRYQNPEDYYKSGTIISVRKNPKLYFINHACGANTFSENLIILEDYTDVFRLAGGMFDDIIDKNDDSSGITASSFNIFNPGCYSGVSDDTVPANINALSYGLEKLKYSPMLNENITDKDILIKHITEVCAYYSGEYGKDPKTHARIKTKAGTCDSFNALEEFANIKYSGVTCVLAGGGKTVGGNAMSTIGIGNSYTTGFSHTDSWNNASGIHMKINWLAYADTTMKWTNFGSTETKMEDTSTSDMNIQIPNVVSDLYKNAKIYNLRSNFKIYYIDIPMLKSYLYKSLKQGETVMKKPLFISDYCWETNNSHYLIFPYMLDWASATQI